MYIFTPKSLRWSRISTATFYSLSRAFNAEISNFFSQRRNSSYSFNTTECSLSIYYQTPSGAHMLDNCGAIIPHVTSPVRGWSTPWKPSHPLDGYTVTNLVSSLDQTPCESIAELHYTTLWVNFGLSVGKFCSQLQLQRRTLIALNLNSLRCYHELSSSRPITLLKFQRYFIVSSCDKSTATCVIITGPVLGYCRKNYILN